MILVNFLFVENLVRDIVENNSISAKEQLANEFKPYIIGFSLKVHVHGYDLIDIQNECYIALFKCIKFYNLDSHRFVAYAMIVIKNTINEIIRKNLRREVYEGTETLISDEIIENTLTSEDLPIEEVLCTKIDNAFLLKILRNLKEDEKELISYVYLEHNSLKNYARLKNIPYSTILNKKNRILKKIKAQIGKKDNLNMFN